MPRTARALFDAAEANGALPVEQTNINGNKVHSHLEKSSKENYTKMMELSDEYGFPYYNTAQQRFLTLNLATRKIF